MGKNSAIQNVASIHALTETSRRVPTVEELLAPRIGAKPPRVRLHQGDAKAILTAMGTKSVGLVLTSPPVEIFTTDGKTKDVRFDTSWIFEAERVADIVVFTIHADALAAVWQKNQLPKPPARIGVWTIGEQGRLGINASSANLILAYGRHPGLRSLPDCLVGDMGDYHWPPSEFHPSPGSYHLFFQIIEHLKPKSVLDPFMGSGVTLHAALTAGCEELIGIDQEKKWVDMVRDEVESRGMETG